MDVILKTFESRGKYFLVLRDPHRREIEIPKVEFDDINNMNDLITKKYKTV